MSEERIRSWFATYRKTGDICLLGGVDRSRTCRYGSREEAEARLAAVIQVNGEAGRPCEGQVEASTEAPEIFAHCPGHPAQAVGGRCFGCGQVLTGGIAQQWADANAAPAPDIPGFQPAGRQPSELSREELVRVVERVGDALYRDGHDGTLDPNKTWDADTIEAVAQALVDAGLRPASPPGGPGGVDG